MKQIKTEFSHLLAMADIKGGQKIIRKYYQSKFGFEVSIYIN